MLKPPFQLRPARGAVVPNAMLPERMDLPGCLLTAFRQGVHEVLSVGIVAEDGLATIAPIEDLSAGGSP